MEEKRRNNRILWAVLFAFITVMLCYMFVVLYFFYISPFNISAKIGFWPFLSDKAIAQTYLDATVQIDFTAHSEEGFEDVNVSVVGVNIRKDGYVVAPYSELKDCDENTKFKINTNSGAVYGGKLLYSDVNYNVSLLKCENIDSTEQIKLPYVQVASKNQHISENVIAVSSPLFAKNYWKGKVSDPSKFCMISPEKVGGFDVVDFVLENCFSVQLADDFSGGAILDKSGILLGLSYKEKLEDETYCAIPVDGIRLFLDDVVKCYENAQTYDNNLVKSIVGFDAAELYCFMESGSMSDGDDNFFYFNGGWQPYTDAIVAYRQTWNFNTGNLHDYFLFEDFVFGDVVIARENVIGRIVNLKTKKSFVINTKLDLFEALYAANDGEHLEIFYQPAGSGDNWQSAVVAV